jgi:cation-transporting ATPase E
MSVTGIWVLSTLSRPIDRIKSAIFVGMVALGVAIFTVPLSTAYFGFHPLNAGQLFWAYGLGLAASAGIEIVNRFARPRT